MEMIIMMIDVETVETLLREHIRVEQQMLDSIDGLVESMVEDDADKSRIARTLKSERSARIKLLNEIRDEIKCGV